MPGSVLLLASLRLCQALLGTDFSQDERVIKPVGILEQWAGRSPSPTPQKNKLFGPTLEHVDQTTHCLSEQAETKI